MKLKRRENRVAIMLPVRVSMPTGESTSLNCLAHTLDVSKRGARLGGVTLTVRPGETIQLHRMGATTAFRVVWVSARQQVGVEALTNAAEDQLWDIPAA